MSRKEESIQATVKSLFKEQGEDGTLFGFTNYRDYLMNLFGKIKGQHPGYSYNQFAEDLGFPPTNAIWLVMTGRRKISPMAMQRIIDALQFKGVHRRFFIALVKQNNANRLADRDRYLADMMEIKAEAMEKSGDSADKLEYFSEWYFPIIREMVGLPYFKSDPNWIAQSLLLKILPKQAEHALELLEKMGLIRWDESLGRHVQTGGSIDLSGDLKAFAAIRYYEKICDLARESITRVPAKQREFNNLTLRLTEEKAKKIQSLLFDLCKVIFEMESSPEEVDAVIYQINTQIFQVMKKTE